MASSTTPQGRQTGNRLKPEKKWQAGIAIGILVFAIAASSVFVISRKKVQLTADGATRVVVTHQTTVAGLLKEKRLVLRPGDEVTPAITARLAKKASVTVYRAVPVTIKVDGQTISLRSAKRTVGAVLKDANVSLSQLDRTAPGVSAAVTDGLSIVVHRVVAKQVVETLSIPFPVLRRMDGELEKGTVKVVRQGAKGVKERTFRLVFEDGKQVKRELASEKITKDPVPELVAVGTKKVIRVLKTSRGSYRYSEMRSMVATAYDPGPKSNFPYNNGKTYLGLQAGYGIVAVDPRVIPLRSRLYIPGYGEALAGDTGGAIKGNRIDLGFNTYNEAIAFGRRRVTVYVLE